MKRISILILFSFVLVSCNKPSSYRCKGYLFIRNETESTIFFESNIESYGLSSFRDEILPGSYSDIAETRLFATAVENVDDLRIEDFIVNYDSAQVSAYYENENGERELIYTWTYASRSDDSIKQLFNMDDSILVSDDVPNLWNDEVFRVRCRFYITDDMLHRN